MIDRTDCPICQSRNTTPCGTYVREESRFSLHRCVDCAHQYWYPRVFSAEVYSLGNNLNQNYMRNIPANSSVDGRRSPWLRFAYRYLQNAFSKTPFRLLDIGSGSGQFLKEIRACFPEADLVGLEIDPSSYDDNHLDKASIRIENETLAEFCQRKQTKRFDVITCFEVIEHQSDPSEFLSLIKKLMCHETVLLLSTPNNERVTVNQLRREAFDFPPNHFHSFSAESLKRLCSNEGLDIQLVPAYRHVRWSEAQYRLVSRVCPHSYEEAIAKEKGLFANHLVLKIFRRLVFWIPSLILTIFNLSVRTTSHFGTVACLNHNFQTCKLHIEV